MLPSRRMWLAYRNPHTSRQHHPGLTGGMTYVESARTAPRRVPRILVAGLLVVFAAIAPDLGYQLLAAPPPTAAPPGDVPRNEHRDALGVADGVVPDGTTVFDD